MMRLNQYPPLVIGMHSEMLFCLFLAVAAVAVECLTSRRIERIYKTRSAPSQGIAIGALTIPWVLASMIAKYLREGINPGKFT